MGGFEQRIFWIEYPRCAIPRVIRRCTLENMVLLTEDAG
jgi:hypothetical protein